MLIRSQSRFYKDGSMAIGLHLDAAKVAMRYEKPALTAVEHSNRLDTRLAGLGTNRRRTRSHRRRRAL